LWKLVCKTRQGTVNACIILYNIPLWVDSPLHTIRHGITRLTQASRDGGVDCVAYDPRPIFGGKVVIQAKRYKNTVGVSAVRDLYGTMQNEEASKGILVTTSGYGKASFEFADGKPIELLSGSNLLYLLAEHAGVEARIEMPDNWKDPQTDS